MNKLKCLTFCLVVLLCLPLKAAATESACRIAAAPVKTLPGKTIQIPIVIEENPGFTNFGISLEYDKKQLELKEIQAVGEEGAYLYSTNTDWITSPEGKTLGYVTAASKEKITGNVTLFVASFSVLENFSGTTQIIPQVYYLRCCDETNGFSDISVMADPIKIIALDKGDINKDCVIEYDDVIAAYSAAMGERQLNAEEVELADLNGNGNIDLFDAQEIYKIYTGGK